MMNVTLNFTFVHDSIKRKMLKKFSTLYPDKLWILHHIANCKINTQKASEKNIKFIFSAWLKLLAHDVHEWNGPNLNCVRMLMFILRSSYWQNILSHYS